MKYIISIIIICCLSQVAFAGIYSQHVVATSDDADYLCINNLLYVRLKNLNGISQVLYPMSIGAIPRPIFCEEYGEFLTAVKRDHDRFYERIAKDKPGS